MTKILEYQMDTPKIMSVERRMQEDSLLVHRPSQDDILQSLPRQSGNHIQGIMQKDNRTSFVEGINEPFLAAQQSLELTEQAPSTHISYPQSTANHFQKDISTGSQATVDITVSVNNYFAACVGKIKERLVVEQNDVLSVTAKIAGQIDSGGLKISQKSRQLQAKKVEKQRAELALMRELQLKKQETMNKLREIQQDEANLFQRIKRPIPRSGSLTQSVMTEAQAEKIALILKRTKQFEERQRQKSLQFVSSIQQNMMLTEERQRLERLRQNQKKKERIALRLKQLQVQQSLRQEMIKNSVVKQKHRYAHIELQKQSREMQSERAKQAEEKLKQIHLRHQLNMQQINQHDRNYSLGLEERSGRSPVNISARALPKREKTYYDRLVEQELFEQKERNYEQIMKVRQHRFKEKIERFQQKVQEEHRPVVDPAKRITVVPRSYSSVSLTKEERFEKGLEYLARAREMKRCASEADPKVVAVQPVAGNSVYKDYMRERERATYDPTEREFKHIIGSKQESQKYQSILRAKYLAQGLQARSKKVGDDRLYSAIRNKLSLLEGLY